MLKITIEKDVSYVGQKDIFIIEMGNQSIPIIHEVSGFMNNEIKPETKTLSNKDLSPIIDAFKNINFTQIFYNETQQLVGYDGWTLKCTISFYMSEISISLWCPSKDSNNPETTKLLQACERIFDLFGCELFDDEEFEEE